MIVRLETELFAVSLDARKPETWLNRQISRILRPHVSVQGIPVYSPHGRPQGTWRPLFLFLILLPIIPIILFLFRR